MTTLSDYQRGYRAAQHRAIRVAERTFDQDGAAEAWENTVRTLKVELAMSAPPDPQSLTQSQAEIS
jgi:hypothetical protein